MNDSDDPNYLLNLSDAHQEQYSDLPGRFEFTVRSGCTRVYSLPDVPSNGKATVNQFGTSEVSFKNDPSGQPTGTAQSNVSGNASYASHGIHKY